MFCSKCGHELRENNLYCSNCGKLTAAGEREGKQQTQTPPQGYPQSYYPPQGYYPPPYGYQPPPKPNTDTGNFGWSVLGFFMPIVGLILYLVWMNDRPKDAKAAGKGALISVIVYAAFIILWIIFVTVILAAAASYAFAPFIPLVP